MRLNFLECGRSMVEMLGVLAIIALLSVIGITGYRNAMEKHKMNRIANDLQMAVVEFIALNRNIDTSSLTKINLGNNSYAEMYKVEKNGPYEQNKLCLYVPINSISKEILNSSFISSVQESVDTMLSLMETGWASVIVGSNWLLYAPANGGTGWFDYSSQGSVEWKDETANSNGYLRICISDFA